MKMKKKAMATFLSVCMLAAVVVPTTIASATGTEQGSPTEENTAPETNPDQTNPDVTKLAVTVTDGEKTQDYATLEEAIANAKQGNAVTLNNDVTLDKTLQIKAGITLNGGGHKISCAESFTPANDKVSALVLVTAQDQVMLQNVKIDGSANNKFPLNIYNSPKVALSGVTVHNLYTKSGAMLVNASNVIVSGTLSISTPADSWYGINVDSGIGVETTPTTLAFTKDTTFTYTNNNGTYNAEGPAAICVDHVTKYKHENSVVNPYYAGLSKPTYDKDKDQNLYHLGKKVDHVTLDNSELVLKPSETSKLTATVAPEDASYPEVNFSSSDTNVATVEQDGTVTAVADGTAAITAFAGGQSATCTVTVKSDEVEPTPPPTPPTPPTSGDVTAPTPDLSQPVVAGNSTNVDAKVEVPQEDLNNATAENPVKIKVDLPTDSLKQTIAGSTTGHVALSVEVPDQAINNANVSMAQIKMEKDVFAQLKESGKTLTIHVAGSNGKDMYSWTFDGSQINDTTIHVNLALNVGSSDNNQGMKEALGNKTGTVLSFAHKGNLPAKATVKVDVSTSFKPGETAYFYYFNPETKAMEAIGDGYLVDADGFVAVSITHCSEYVLTKEKLPVTTTGTNSDQNSLTTPQTGDNTNLAISIAAVTAAGAAVTGFIVIKKRKIN